MKNTKQAFQQKSILLSFLLVIFTIFSTYSQDEFVEYSGKVVDSESGSPLVFASLEVSNTNISTITNNDGEFLLKVPTSNQSSSVIISFLGYKKQIIE